MWQVQKMVMRAKPVIINNDWEFGVGQDVIIVKGRTMAHFLDTCADLANNKTGIMACGVPSICKKSGLSRATVLRCLAIARRHRFLIDTGERLPAPYDTIMYRMDPWVFFRLQYGYLDTYYESDVEVAADLDLGPEVSAMLHFMHDVYAPAALALWPRPSSPHVTQEEETKMLRKLIDHPEFYWAEKSDKCWWKPAQKRAAFVKVGKKMDSYGWAAM